MQFGQPKRREFISLLGGAVAWPLTAQAQRQADQFHRIGILHSGTEASVARNLTTFRNGMQELGYVEGRNIHYDYHFDDGYLDRLTALAAETVRRNPSLIVSAPLPANLAAKQATTTIPIVMATGADPVKFGLVTSLSHPGGNLTGLTNFSEVLASKQIDLLRDLMPRLSRLGVLVSTSNPLHAPQLRDIEQATNEAGLFLIPFEVPRPEAPNGPMPCWCPRHHILFIPVAHCRTVGNDPAPGNLWLSRARGGRRPY
jgi:putative ABC transport system substrate-binding protein